MRGDVDEAIVALGGTAADEAASTAADDTEPAAEDEAPAGTAADEEDETVDDAPAKTTRRRRPRGRRHR
jgi:hypothetical protein